MHGNGDGRRGRMTAEIKAYINDVVETKLRSSDVKKRLTITRAELLDPETGIGRTNYENGLINGHLNPLKAKGRNATVRFRYSEVEAYLDMLSEG